MRIQNVLFALMFIVVSSLAAGMMYAQANVYVPIAQTSAPAVQAADMAPFAAAPACASHDDELWHGLWNADLGCHYNHSHGDNPHDVDDIFGIGFYGIADGEISYPWQTAGENHHKHETYKWLVRRDLPCIANPDRDCISAFRTQIHADLFNVTSIYHSFYVEALTCPKSDLTDCGIIRFGGWQHSGDLLIDMQTVMNVETPAGLSAEKRHFDLTDNRHRAVWYLNSPSTLARVNLQTADMWGYYPMPALIPITTSLTISDMVFFGGANDNGSRLKPHSLQFAILYRHRATLDPDGDGYANYSGYVNQYGDFVSDCEAPCQDCVPVEWQHVKIPTHAYQVELGTAADFREYDVLFNGQSSGWISYPN